MASAGSCSPARPEGRALNLEPAGDDARGAIDQHADALAFGGHLRLRVVAPRARAPSLLSPGVVGQQPHKRAAQARA